MFTMIFMFWEYEPNLSHFGETSDWWSYVGGETYTNMESLQSLFYQLQNLESCVFSNQIKFFPPIINEFVNTLEL